MKSLILGALILSIFGTRAAADRSAPSSHDTPSPNVLEPAASRAGGPMAVPSKTGWNINVVDALEVGLQYSIHVDGEVAYIGYSGMLAVLDISDLAAPRKVGYAFLAGTCYRIDQSGDYLYCVIVDNYDDDDLVIVDISDRANPLVLQTLPIQGRDIDVDGNYLYAEHGTGLRVFDISNPTSPVLLGFCPGFGMTDVEARDGIVYVARGIAAGQTGLQIIDATDPTNPTEIAFLPVPGGAYHIDVSGTYVYVVTYYAPDSFCVINVANPSTPTIISTTLGVDFYDVAVKGDYAFVGDDSALQVFDVSDPGNPVVLPPLETPCDTDYVIEIEVGGNVAALVVDDGICFVDLSVPSNPLDVAAHKALPWANTLDVSGSRLAVSLNYGQMAWVDRYDPTIRTIVEGHSGAIDGSDVVVRGNYAYMTMDDSNYNTYDGLEIFDISDPANVVSVGHMYTPWFPGPLAAGASHVYIGPSGAMWVIDVSNPSAPTKVGELPMGVGGLFADEPYLYVRASGYLTVVDVAIPSSPTAVASLPLAGTGDVWVLDSMAYVTAAQALHIIDVSNPLQPTSVGTFPTTSTYSVRVRDKYAYVSDRDYLRIVDVTDPSDPVEVGNIATPLLWSRVVAAPPYVYAVTYYGPMLVLETPMMTAVSREQRPEFLLEQNYPNPFNPSTTIPFDTPSSGRVRVEIFDVHGRLVRALIDQSMPAGAHAITWDGRDDAGNTARSGVYFYRLEANGTTEARKMVILK